MMKSYTAYCMNEDGENLCMTREYEAKKHFIDDLHGNGYKVHFVALTDKYDEESEKYNARRIAKNRAAKIRRDQERAWAKRREEIRAEIEAEMNAEEAEEEQTTAETTEETTTENQEVETMRFKKEFLNVEVKSISKYNAIRFDADTSFYITNCTEAQEPEALRKSLEKFVELLRKHGGAEILVESLEMNLNCNEYGTECIFNEIRNGGNAYEIEINRYNDTTLSIYIRICEHQDAPEEEQDEEEQPEEVPSFESVKDQLFAKVEHISAKNADIFSDYKTVVWRSRGNDVAHSIWISGERLNRETLRAWEENGVTEAEVFRIAMENTMATQKPRLHRNIFDTENEPLESCALLESFFNIEALDDDKTVLATTTDNRKGGAIALFYPPVLSKICELFGGSGFYVAFTSIYEGMIHKLGSIDPASIRRNVRETNRIFEPADTLSNDVFFYDPQIKRLVVVPE